MKPRRLIYSQFIILVLCTSVGTSQTFLKSADDDGSKYTTIGNIGVTITNYGTLGNGFTGWPNQPSLEYPKGSGIEHLFLGGIWIGGIPRKEGVAHVSTAAVDIGSVRRLAEGFEMTSNIGSVITQRSTLSESPFFDIGAISHQDLVMDFTDRNTRIPDTGDSIPNHRPLGVDIHLESYAWNFPFADFFVILNYTIKNASADTIDGLYIGLWNNGVVRNTKLTGRPGGRDFYNHSAKGFIDSLRLGYTFDFDGSPYGPPANSYYGYKLLGTDPFPLQDSAVDVNKTYYYANRELDTLGSLYKNTYYNGWKFNNRAGSEVYFFPDLEFLDNSFRGKYQRLSRMMPKPNLEALSRPPNVLSSDGITTGEAPASMTDLLSVGPFRAFAPGDSIKVIFALVCAKKTGSSAPSEDYKNANLRTLLYSNAGWAQQAYNGEDLNGNNKLDPGEDINGDGILSRFSLPQPPRQPRVRAVVENQRATIYWDKVQSEQSFDPISRKYDFEGYRIYRSAPGVDVANPENFLLSMQLVGEFDRSEDNIGYNTGMEKIKLDAPKKFDGDTVEYWYQFPPKDDPITSLNGWQYLYGVSAFDGGDSANGLPSLESAKVIKRVVPGVGPDNAGTSDIGVYPNPYYANAAWDGSGERTRKIYFTHLPPRAEIKIYTITGDLVAELQHNAATYDGSGIKWFDDYKTLGLPPVFGGGEHAWDLISKYDQAIATGLYLFTVKNLENDEVKRGKFVIVK